MFCQPYPTLNDLQNGLSKWDCIKYAAYRTAAKLRLVQKALNLDKVELKIISSVFDRHHLQQTENSVKLDQREAESVLSDIYFAVKKGKVVNLDVDFVSHLAFDFLTHVFDKHRSNTIKVLSFKIGLTLLCEAKPREKYCYLFAQVADHNNCLSRKKLEILLKKIIKLTEYLGEGLSFGSQLIPGTVESCFQCNVGGLGLSEDGFMQWLMQDPQLLVWLSTLYRMQISELVSHNAKCGICKIYPIVGLRYRCLRCLSYDMCQICFFTGKMNKKHKLKHPVQEYCCPMSSQQATKAFLLTLRNRLYKKDCKLQYLPALRVDSPNVDSCTTLLDEFELSSRTVINGSRLSLHRFPYKELHNIIQQLERESEKIIPQIDNFCSGVGNSNENECKSHLRSCLMKHKAQVKTQVQKLKCLRKVLASNLSFETKAIFASTPVVDEILSKRDLNVDLGNLSPITVRTLKKGRDGKCEKKMMWDNYDLGGCGLNPSWEEVQSVNVEKTSNTQMMTEIASMKDWKDEGNESDVDLSCWLGGSSIQELDSSSRKGITWLYTDENRKSDEEKIKEENEKALEELQFELKKILNKIQELSVLTLNEDKVEESFPEEKRSDSEMVTELDTLLVDLVNGIEKLMGS